MGSLIAALVSAADTIHTYQRSLQVLENNVTNASTPGWATQVQPLVAERLRGDVGGVTTGDLLSARSEFLEQGVRSQQENAGYASQRATDLTALQTTFSISSDSSLASNLDSFFTSVSQWSVNPNDMPSRQVVLERSTTVAQSFNSVSSSLGTQTQRTEQEIRSTVDGIDNLAKKLVSLNTQRRQDFASAHDPGLEAGMYSTLEELSKLTSYTALPQPDGTISVSIGGQAPLVVGDHLYPIQARFSAQQAQIVSPDGTDVTPTLAQGQLGALLTTRNQELPTLAANLDTFASQFADQVNTVLGNGVDVNGSSPTQGLFTYDPNAPALSLAVTPITADQLAGATPANPGGNENVLNLENLGNTPQINGLTYGEYYGNLAAGVGRNLASAQSDRSLSNQLLSQAQTARSDAQGVSLDAEAAHLVELQRGYQAVGKLLTTLSDLTTVALQMIQ